MNGLSIKDLIIKMFFGSLGLGLLAYIIRLFSTGANVIVDDFDSYNVVALVFFAIIALYVVALAIFPGIFLPDNRRSLLLLGIGVIFTSHLYLQDIPDSHIYLADFMKVFGILILIAGPTKLFASKEYEEQKFEEEIEVYEV